MSTRGPYTTGSLAEIARRAGVSTATASRVLNHSPRVRPGTRHAVLKALNDLQGVAKASETMTIGVCVNDFHDDRLNHMYMQDLFAGILQSAHRLDFAIKAIDLQAERRTDETYPQAVMRLGLGGLIHLMPLEDFFGPIAEIADTGFPQCIIGGKMNHPKVNWIDPENIESSCKAVEYLLHLGHRRIAFVAVDVSQYDIGERLAGYKLALAGAGIPFDPALKVVRRHATLDMGVSAMTELLTRPDRPTAVYFTNNELALGGVRACRKLGVAIPEEVSIISIGDSKMAEWITPQLTLLSQPVFEIGRRAALSLATQVRHGEGPIFHEVVSPEFMINESTGPVKA
ncbi:MAG: LacI family DNA-binding transcriptional regulator [Lentisphaeria bacterium]